MSDESKTKNNKKQINLAFELKKKLNKWNMQGKIKKFLYLRFRSSKKVKKEFGVICEDLWFAPQQWWFLQQMV